MTELKKASNEELEAELERRKKEKSVPPDPLKTPNFEPLRKMIIEGIQRAAKDEEIDDDFTEYVYEAALEAVYGDKFWDWYNKRDW